MVRQLSKHSDIKDFIDVGCGAGEMASDLVLHFGHTGTGIAFS